jgi:redox-sensitive bicupin YhaK (pirin superfamily)
MVIIKGKPRDLGDGFMVSRLLPQIERRSIGPFVFFDHFGPVTFAPGQGVDVRPHPHIGLATVTYLFEGAQVHRDSLGSVQTITPGDVNWMTAGRGIVHSERTGPELRARGHLLHGIQSWVALPQSEEESDPSFQHVGRGDLPEWREGEVVLRVIAGHAYGRTSPARVLSPTLYVDAILGPNGRLPLPEDHEERGVFVVSGELRVGGQALTTGDMAVFHAGSRDALRTDKGARVMLLGGAAIDGRRHLWWNFVSSSKERIEQAKADWRAQRMGQVPGETELIPLPD